MVVEMLQSLGGHKVHDRITVDQADENGWVEVPAEVVAAYVAAGYVEVVEP